VISGEFRNTLDDKGRLMIPSRLRSDIPNTRMILTQGIDKCLWLFPEETWQAVSESLMNNTSVFQSKTRMIHRRIIAPAMEAEIDKAGRISIPPSLREFARLDKECVILGMIKYIEIWNDTEYGSYWDEHEDLFQEASEELGALVKF